MKLEYPFYSVSKDVWDAKRKRYELCTVADVQTYDEAIAIARKIDVNAKVLQVQVHEEGEDYVELLATKVAVENDPKGYEFYDERTGKDIE